MEGQDRDIRPKQGACAGEDAGCQLWMGRKGAWPDRSDPLSAFSPAWCCRPWQVRIGLTALAYSHEGLRLADCAALVGRLKAELELQRGPMHERPAYATFEGWRSEAAEAALCGSGPAPGEGGAFEDGAGGGAGEAPPPPPPPPPSHLRPTLSSISRSRSVMGAGAVPRAAASAAQDARRGIAGLPSLELLQVGRGGEARKGKEMQKNTAPCCVAATPLLPHPAPP